jgi:DNA-binding protein YbaB
MPGPTPPLGPLDGLLDPSAAPAAEAQLRAIESGFREAQASLREELVHGESTDGSITLELNGEGLACSVNVSPALLEQGAPAVERAIMEAVNNGTMALLELTTAVMQLAAVQHLGIRRFPDVPGVPPSEGR